MIVAFYIAAAVALLATGLVVTRRSAVHALLYLVVSLLAVAVIFLLLGAAFAAALEVIIYAGAIMVLFLFVVMMVEGGSPDDPNWPLRDPRAWIGPAPCWRLCCSRSWCWHWGRRRAPAPRRSVPRPSASGCWAPTCSPLSWPRCCSSPAWSVPGTWADPRSDPT